MQCLGTHIIRGGREQPQATTGPSMPTSKWSGRDVGRVIDEGSDGEEGKREVWTLAALCPLPFILTSTNMHIQATATITTAFFLTLPSVTSTMSGKMTTLTSITSMSTTPTPTTPTSTPHQQNQTLLPSARW